MTSNATHTLNSAGSLPMRKLLDQRFGDGSIYLFGSEQRAIFDLGRAQGLIAEDGQITTSGRRFLAGWTD